MLKDDISFNNEEQYDEMYNDIPKIYIREYLMDLPEDRWFDILL